MPSVTISDTFARYNVVATIYIIGPLSILFLLRVYTTLRCGVHEISIWRRKCVCILLLLSQYTLFTVIRFDAIKGVMHGVVTMLTFVLLLLYHYLTRHSSRAGKNLMCGIPVKTVLGGMSIGCISVFAVMAVAVQHPEQQQDAWTIAVSFEIAGVVLLGAMDMVDVYDLGEGVARQELGLA